MRIVALDNQYDAIKARVYEAIEDIVNEEDIDIDDYVDIESIVKSYMKFELTKIIRSAIEDYVKDIVNEVINNDRN